MKRKLLCIYSNFPYLQVNNVATYYFKYTNLLYSETDTSDYIHSSDRKRNITDSDCITLREF